MKKIILFLISLCSIHLLQAQVKMTIGTGAFFVVSGASHLVMDTGNFVNNGTYSDSSGVFKAVGGVNFDGTGTTRMNNLTINNAQHSKVNSPVSVYNTANLVAGDMDANNELYIRSDANATANMVVSGVLTNQVRGIVVRVASTTAAGCTSYTADLNLNISGPAMKYQWQSSSDSSVWSEISGATLATFTATVTATSWYRCFLSTNNSPFTQFTAGKKLNYTGALPAITGPATVCTGMSVTVSNAVSGGTWSSSNPSRATVDAATGVVTAISGGTTTISYSLSPTCYRTIALAVYTSPLPINGNSTVCEGLNTALSNYMGSGTWSSADPGVATIGLGSGTLTGVSAGTAVITYTMYTGCIITRVQTVNLVPATITGTPAICAGSTTTLSTTTTGGTWVSSLASTATIDSVTGLLTGVIGGMTTISYRMPTGCNTIKAITVHNLPAVITGPLTMCQGGITTLSSSTSGGTWSSLTPATVSVIAGTGVTTGVTTGFATISYTLVTGCARTAVVTVNSVPYSISGSATVCVGATSALTSAPAGGTWSSSNTSKATVNVTTGVVTGVATGTSNITYTIAGAGCFNSAQVTINSAPVAITGTTNVCIGSTTALSHTVSGGTWSSSNTAVGTVDATSGVVTGMSNGAVNITYTVSPGCFRTILISVLLPPIPITTSGIVCAGSTLGLSSSPAGGTWTSTSTANATIGLSSGVLTGVAAGTTLVSYVASPGCYVTREITINPLPDAITGTTVVCAGSTSALSSAPASGAWTSSNTSKATVDISSGLVTGVAAGTATITYVLPSGCRRTIPVTIGTMPSAISGTLTVCAGSTTTLTGSPAGGTWLSTNTAVATVPSSPGLTTGVAAGTTTISYTQSGCSRTAVVTVNPALTSITGDFVVCAGNTTPLGNATAGGTWASSVTAKATVNVTTGLTAGVSAGTSNITYRKTPTCFTTAQVTVNGALAAITGTASICAGTTTTLSIAATDGTWSSSNTAKATVDITTGIVTGVSTGTAIISYIQSTGCYKTITVVVNALPATIGGPSVVCVGSSITLTNTSGGGSWSYSGSSIAMAASSGVAVGVSPGTSLVSYQLFTGCRTTREVTVNALPVITAGPTHMCTGQTYLFSAVPGSGVWTSSSSSVATIGSSTGLATALAGGGTTIKYTATTGCFATQAITVNSSPNNITGTASVFIGATTTLASTTSGGTWSSSEIEIATAGSSSGIVTGVSSGTSTISYILTATGCYKTRVVTVNLLPSARPLAEVDDAGDIIRVYPNPTKGLLTVEATVKGTFILFTLEGKEVERYITDAASTSITLPYDLAAGVYMCRFNGDDGSSKTIRLVYAP